MKRPGGFTVTILSLVAVGAVSLADPAAGRQQSMKEQLVGTWTLVSAVRVGSDGSRADVFGPNPKGTLIHTSDGHFALVQTRADLATPGANGAAGLGSIAYFGTYTVDEVQQVITLQLEGSTSANLMGEARQERIVTALSADDFTFLNRRPGGATLEVVWKRAR